MRKLALVTLPLLLATAPAWAQANSSFNNQTGNAQNASRMSGLHTGNGQVHQMDTNAANSYSGSTNTGAGNGNASFPDRLTTATAPPSQNGAMPLAGQAAPGAGANGAMPDSGGASPAAPH